MLRLKPASAEFDRQVATLVERGYPAAAGLTERRFTARLQPLRAAAISLDPAADAERGAFGFVIVVSGISLAGSRCGDRRVTTLWISQGAPKLGWCWAGNPHTWLGVGSCAQRLGAAA